MLLKLVEPAHWRKAATVARHVELHDIALCHADAQKAADTDEVSEWKIALQDSADFAYRKEERLLLVQVQAQMNATAAETDRQVCSISCQFEARYEFGPDGTPPEEELAEYLAAFAKVNGIYNVWPYFRELTHSMIARMGWGHVVVPVLQIRPRKSEQSESQTP